MAIIAVIALYIYSMFAHAIYASVYILSILRRIILLPTPIVARKSLAVNCAL